MFRLLKGSRPRAGDSTARPEPGPTGDRLSAHADILARAAGDRDSGRFAAALRALDEALTHAPDDGEFIAGRAATLLAWGRHREALAAYARAAELGARTADVDAGVATARAALGQFDEAIVAARRAISAVPAAPQWRYLVGLYQAAAGRHAEAIATIEAVIDVDPRNLDARIELCRSLILTGDLSRAIAGAQRICDEHPTCAKAFAMLGIAEALQNHPQKSLQWLASAEAVAGPDSDLEVFDQIAVALAALGRDRESVAMLEQRLPSRPNLNAYLAYSTALLAEGRYLDGWRQFEFRWFSEGLGPLRPNYGKPVWCGQELAGKSVLVCAEQGFGDVFQMLRYLPLLKARGAHVLLQPIAELQSMYGELSGVDVFLEAGRPLPPFDYFVHLMSLPRALATTVSTIPATVPYIRVNAARQAHWRSRLGETPELKVGIVWAGSPKHSNDANRSIPFSVLAPLLEIPRVRFFGLQRPQRPAESERDSNGAKFVNLGPELRDFGDTAAIIGQLDLLISVDTAVVHLGGALGRQVWVLLPQPAEYRWLKEREDTPWYPTVRLFRQRRSGDWGEVIARVVAELSRAAELKSGGAGAAPLAKQLAPQVMPRAMEPDSARLPPGIGVASLTRAGLMQFDPAHDAEGRSLDWYGDYLHPVLETVVGLVLPGDTMLEAGSGYGSHAIMLGRVLGPQGHLIAYEPDPVTRRMLGHNLAANHVQNVTLMRRRLGRPEGVAGVRADAGKPIDEESLDDLRLERLDWLKINAAVDARTVLAGAQECLWRLRPCVFVCAADAAGMPDMARFCGTFGYRSWKVDSPYFHTGNFNCRTDDIFNGAGVRAVLAIPEEVDVSVALEPLQAG